MMQHIHCISNVILVLLTPRVIHFLCGSLEGCRRGLRLLVSCNLWAINVLSSLIFDCSLHRYLGFWWFCYLSEFGASLFPILLQCRRFSEMAMKSDEVFYDPLYRPQDGARRINFYNNNNNNNEKRFLFDDFSVANHVHILKPQLVSVNTNSVLQTQKKEYRSKEDLKNQG